MTILKNATSEYFILFGIVIHNTNAHLNRYELVGVTVHTGTADGGHYYSFIKERTKTSYHTHERWFLFNDAEVKPFDPSQIAAECFGGEMTVSSLLHWFSCTKHLCLISAEQNLRLSDGEISGL